MVTTLAPQQRDNLAWLTPSPMWDGLGDLNKPAVRGEFKRPAILRFAHDAFMDELMATLAYSPETLGEWRVQPETWEKPMRTPRAVAKLALPEPVSKLSVRRARIAARRPALPPVDVSPASQALVPFEPAQPLKLYQPIQQRHYVVTGSLVCQRPGLPDRRLDPGKQERAGFVVRRIVLPDGETVPGSDPASWDECAYVLSPTGATWQRVKDGADARANRILPGEERLPLFSVGFDDPVERKRRLFGGVIPVGRRETYVAAATRAAPALDGSGGGGSSTSNDAPADPRRMQFLMQVTGPWFELVGQMLDQKKRYERSPPGDPVKAKDDWLNLNTAPPDNATTPPDALVQDREQVQTISWHTLLDFVRFLKNHIPRVYEVLSGTGTLHRSDLSPQNEVPLLQWLENVELDATLKSDIEAGESVLAKANLLAALTEIASHPAIGDGLDAVDVPYRRHDSNPDPRWPNFLFPLADPITHPFSFFVGDTDRDAVQDSVNVALEHLADLVEKALPAASDDIPMPEIYVQAKPQFDTRAAWFAIRCVYERPNCGPLDPPVVSEPTRPFQMANYYDPEAPSRPVRIPLPFDISPGGLRKFNKSTTLMISDMLCGQLKKIRKLTLGDLVLSVLPWPFHKDLPNPEEKGGPCGDGDFGMFCSLSIPIVTICALILLIIIVSLFDMFFHWLPFLFWCFPVFGLKGKKK